MKHLGVLEHHEVLQISSTSPVKKEKTKRRKEHAPSETERRKSRRLQGVSAPEGMLQDDDDAEWEEQLERKRKRRGTTQEELAEMSRKWIEKSRESLLKLGKGDTEILESEVEWKIEAERRWGSGVRLQSEGDTSWKKYVLSRLSTPPPPSPKSLLQEFYAHDTWRLLVCCILMSRVSSGKVKHQCISGFFEKYPTPTDFIHAKSEDCQNLLYPLGLFENRIKSLIALTERYLSQPEFDVALKGENKIYGIGQFGIESYYIFCKSMMDIRPKDATLASYIKCMKHG